MSPAHVGNVVTLSATAYVVNRNNSVLAAALDYARRGYPVFPVGRNKKPFKNSNGLLDATTNPAQIRAWWQNAPGRGIAVRTGGGLMVADIDVKNGINGFTSLAELAWIMHRGGRV